MIATLPYRIDSQPTKKNGRTVIGVIVVFLGETSEKDVFSGRDGIWRTSREGIEPFTDQQTAEAFAKSECLDS